MNWPHWAMMSPIWATRSASPRMIRARKGVKATPMAMIVFCRFGPSTALIVSAHAADFVWRCGGAIALHAELGYDVTVVCLSYGERGESAKLWKQDGMTLDKVKAARRAEAEAAAAALGVSRATLHRKLKREGLGRQH